MYTVLMGFANAFSFLCSSSFFIYTRIILIEIAFLNGNYNVSANCSQPGVWLETWCSVFIRLFAGFKVQCILLFQLCCLES